MAADAGAQHAEVTPNGGAGLDGCTAAPFSCHIDHKITWAGPYVNFRADSLSFDFRWLSAREIDPLP
jgi:hypothetical protein